MARLDVLRAVAILLVIGNHVALPAGAANSAAGNVMRSWFGAGWMGVDLFFVLSGFLVSGLLFQEFESRGRVKFGRFLIRRGFKIYPAFYVFLAVCAYPNYIVSHAAFGWTAVICEALFVQNYGPAVFNHTWSLAVEEHFYLLLVLLFLILLRRNRTRPFQAMDVLALTLPVIVLAVRLVVAWQWPFDLKMALFTTHARIDALFFGVTLAYLCRFHPNRLAWSGTTWGRVAIAIGATAAFVPALLFDRSVWFMHTIYPTLSYLAFGGVLLLALPAGAPSSPPGKIASVLAFIGTYSYSIYLWHAPMINWGAILFGKVFNTPMPFAVYLVHCFVSTIIIGIVMAKAIEVPFLKVRDRLFPAMR